MEKQERKCEEWNTNQNVKQNEKLKKGSSKNFRHIDIKDDDLGKSLGCVCRLQSPSKITLVPLFNDSQLNTSYCQDSK